MYYSPATLATGLFILITCIKVCSLLFICLYAVQQPIHMAHMLHDHEELHYELHIHEFEKKLGSLKTGPVK